MLSLVRDVVNDCLGRNVVGPTGYHRLFETGAEYGSGDARSDYPIFYREGLNPRSDHTKASEAILARVF